MSQAKSGQVLLIVLLTSAVMLTVGLALTSRTVTDVNISTQKQEHVRSFNAAEAGIEDLLGNSGGLADVVATVGPGNCDASNPCSADDMFGAGSREIDYSFYLEEGGAATSFETSERVSNGDIYQLDLAGFAGTGIMVYWQGLTTGAELIFVYNNAGTISINKKLVGDSGVSCFTDDKDLAISASSSPFPNPANVYNWYYSIPPAMITNLQYIRVRPLCGSTYLGFVSAGGNFPAQNYLAHVESRGLANEDAGENVAALEAVQNINKSLPSIFDFALYSGGNIEISP